MNSRKKADGLPVAAGGESHLAAAKVDVWRALQMAAELGVVRLIRPTDVIIEKVQQ